MLLCGSGLTAFPLWIGSRGHCPCSPHLLSEDRPRVRREGWLAEAGRHGQETTGWVWPEGCLGQAGPALVPPLFLLSLEKLSARKVSSHPAGPGRTRGQETPKWHQGTRLSPGGKGRGSSGQERPSQEPGQAVHRHGGSPALLAHRPPLCNLQEEVTIPAYRRNEVQRGKWPAWGHPASQRQGWGSNPHPRTQPALGDRDFLLTAWLVHVEATGLRLKPTPAICAYTYRNARA